MDSILPGERIESFVSPKGSYQVKFLTMFLLLIPYAVITYTKINVNPWIVYATIIIVTVVLYNRICRNCHDRRRKVRLTELLQTAKTGDLVLFKTSTSYDIPEFIYYRMASTILTNTDWSHVGLVVRSPYTGELFIWESAEDPSYDTMTGKDVSGIKLSDFNSKIKNYHGYVGYRSLRKPLSDKYNKILYHTCQKYKGTPFKSKLLSGKEYNCAEAVSDLLEKVGIYNGGSRFMRMTPGNFSSSGNKASNLVWLDEYCLSEA